MASWIYNALLGAPIDVAAKKPLLSGESDYPIDKKTSGADGTTKKSSPPRLLELPALNILRQSRVILASASPRRKQLLQRVSLHAPPSCSPTLIICAAWPPKPGSDPLDVRGRPR